jgi:hypothetical protein
MENPLPLCYNFYKKMWFYCDTLRLEKLYGRNQRFIPVHPEKRPVRPAGAAPANAAAVAAAI